MRILYFADIRFPLERANGIQTMETCYALAERGHDVSLVVKPDTHVPRRDPFQFYGLPRLTGTGGALHVEHANAPAGAGMIARTGYLSFAAGRALGRGRADVILTRDLGVASFLLRLPRAVRAPLVYESHGFAPDVAKALPDLVPTASPPSDAKLKRLAARERTVWNGAEGYVAITRGIVEHMEQHQAPRPRLAVIPDGVRSPSTKPVDPPATRVVAYAGHLYAWKGVDVLVRALAELPDVSGLIVGGHEKEPDLARLQTLAGELGVTSRITFTGLLEPRRVAEHLAGAQVLVLPNPSSAISTHFTSPLKLFEYMAAGRTIVASDLPSIREVLRHGENAWLVEPGSSAALAQGIGRVLGDRPLSLRLARAAAADSAQYSWGKRAERLESLFRDVTAA